MVSILCVYWGKGCEWEAAVSCACVYCDECTYGVWCGMGLGKRGVWRHRAGGRGRLSHTLLLGVLLD